MKQLYLQSPKYRKAVIASEKLIEQLSERLSKEDYEQVQKKEEK